MSEKKSWKEDLLKSGLPLENDVRRAFDKRGCLSSFEFSYIKQDENRIEKEFSFDIDSSYIVDDNFFELMIECKYRHESTRWVFTPANYGGFRELMPLDFLHVQDYFVSTKFPYRSYFPIQIGPACGKGVEITSTGNNDKSITQAITQLSYAFAPKVTSAIEHQVYDLLSGDYIFYHLPVIVTTARLYRLRECVDIEAIKKATNIEDVADEHDILVIDNDIGSQLVQYNKKCFDDFRRKTGDSLLEKKNTSFAKGLDHFFEVMSKYYCPNAILVLRHDESEAAYDKLFNLISNVLDPSDEISSLIEQQRRKVEEYVRKFE